MKKIFILSMLIPSVALAIKIDANTQLKWNSMIVKNAALSAGLTSRSKVSEISLTYNRIMLELLGRATFSVSDAVSVCMKQCNKSEYLKNNGHHGRRCPDICKKFGEELVKSTDYNKDLNEINGKLHAVGKIYTEDGLFYFVPGNNKKFENGDGFEYPNKVFDSSTNELVAKCTDFHPMWGDDVDEGSWETSCEFIYDGVDRSCELVFSVYAHDDGADGVHLSYFSYYSLRYDDLQSKIKILKKLDYSRISSMVSSDMLEKTVNSDMNKIISKRSQINDFVNKVESANFTPESYKLCTKVKLFIQMYEDMGFSKTNYNYDGIFSKINCVKAYLKKGKNFPSEQTKSLKEAEDHVKLDMMEQCNWYLDNVYKYIDIDKFKCAGDCKGTGQDFVTCTFGNSKGTFEFDDICDGNWKQKAKSFFGK